MSAALRWDLTTRDIPGVGLVAYVLPVVSEDLPPQLREAVICRRLAAVEGRCPCGATVTLPNREQRRRAAREGRQLTTTVEHEPDCPASDDRITALVRAAR